MNFDHKTVLITGAAGNLGRAVAQAFADNGARLALVGRHTDSLRQAFGDENAQRLFVAADLLQPEQVSAAVSTAVGASDASTSCATWQVAFGWAMRCTTRRAQPGTFCSTSMPVPFFTWRTPWCRT